MNKIFFGIISLALIASIATYIFIPSKIEIISAKNVNIFPEGITKFLSAPDKLDSCFRIVADKKDSMYSYKGFNYKLKNILYNITQIDIQSNHLSTTSNLLMHNNGKDSTALFWTTQINTSINPLTRIRQYLTATDLKTSMDDILDKMKIYLNNPINIYGVVVKEIEVSDSTLISTKFTTDKEPGIAEIYAHIKKLEDYAKLKNADTTNPPMLNTQRIDAGKYETMVALPVNKLLDETSEIKVKRVPYQGKMFVSAITGGPYTIKNSLQKMEVFVTDSKRSVVAIPFEMLMTNRINQPDTTKWVTRIYFPVI